VSWKLILIIDCIYVITCRILLCLVIVKMSCKYTSLSTKLEVDTVREGEAVAPDEKCSQCAWTQNYLSDLKFSCVLMYSWFQLLPCPKTLTLESAATRLSRSTPHR